MIKTNNLESLQSMDSTKIIFALLFLLSNRLETVGSQFLKQMTSKQWFLLAAITTCFSTPPSIGEAAAWVGLSHQNVKQVPNRLSEKGFLKLQKDMDDRRVVRLIVTEKAYEYEKNSQ